MVGAISQKINFKAFSISDENVAKLRKQMEDSGVGPEVLDSFNASIKEQIKEDTVEKQKTSAKDEETPKKKNGIKNFFASVAKFFTSTQELAKGVVSGFAYGSMTGVGLMAGAWFVDALPKAFKKGGSFKQTIMHPIKSMSSKSKIVSTIGAIGVFGYHVVKGKLQANQRNAFVDQKLNNLN